MPAPEHDSFQTLSAEDRHAVMVLTPLLRLADSLKHRLFRLAPEVVVREHAHRREIQSFCKPPDNFRRDVPETASGGVIL
jgi:hypothetical protein